METDEWKCCVFFCGLLFRALRAQTGRVSSANTGQRVSLLTVAILVSRVAESVLHELSRGGFGDTIDALIRKRAGELRIEQALMAKPQIFQEDLLQLEFIEEAEGLIMKS